MISTIAILAVKSDDIANILKKYEDYFSSFSIIKDMFRELGWMLIKGLMKLIEWLYLLNDKSIELLNFMDSEDVNRFFTGIKPFVYTVLFLALCYLGFCYLIAHKKPEGILSNIILFFLVILVLPWGMSELTVMTKYGIEAINGDMSGDNCYKLMQPYITDLLYLDSIDFDESKIGQGKINGYTENTAANIKYLNPTEVLDPSDYELANKDLFKKQLVSEIKDGQEKISAKKIKKNKFLLKDITPYYYRYHINFFFAILAFIALIIVLVFSAYKLGTLVFELVMEKMLAPFIAAGDITNGQKIRKLLTSIISAYVTILTVFMLQKMYIVFSGYVSSKQWVDNAAGNTFIKIIFLLIGAAAVIDGPNFFEQIFGIDAGLKSLSQQLQSMYYSSQMAGGVRQMAHGVGQKISGLPGKAAGKIGKAGKTAAGISGLLKGFNETGVLQSQNEKISDSMAQSGNGNPKGMDANMNIQNQMQGDSNNNMVNNQETNNSMQGNNKKSPLNASDSIKTSRQETHHPEKEKTDIPSGGRQNLQGTDNVSNDKINDLLSAGSGDTLNNDLNNSQVSEGMNRQTEGGLVNWALHNTKAGNQLSQSYEAGKNLGHAAGVTLNKLQGGDK